jgi:hypothetical protein
MEGGECYTGSFLPATRIEDGIPCRGKEYPSPSGEAMRLKVNYLYPMRYVPERCFNQRGAHFRASTDVDVREIPEGDAVPAFRVSMPGNARLSAIKGEPRLIVSWGGRLWADSGLSAEELEARLRDQVPGTPLDASDHLGRGGAVATDAASLRRKIVNPPKSWNDDGGVALASKIALRAEDLLLVGGRLFSRDYEPCWYFDSYADTVSVVSARSDPTDRFGSHYREILMDDARRIWRADRLSAARRQGMRGEAKGKIEVLDQSAIRHSDDSDALAAWAAAVAGHLSPHLHVLPSGAVAALLDLRDALAASGGSSGPAVADALQTIAGLAAVRIPTWLSGAADASEARDEAVTDATKALRRWEARPRDGLEWVERGLPLTGTRSASGPIREILDAAEADRLARGLRMDLGDAPAQASCGMARLLAIGHAHAADRYAYSAAKAPLAAVLARADGVFDVWCADGFDETLAKTLALGHLARATAPGPDDLSLQVRFGAPGADEAADDAPDAEEALDEEFAP